MKLIINGESRQTAEATTVAALILQEGADPGRVAVLLNDRVVPAREREATTLREGDRVEMLTLAGGG
ncbi:TPA: thiamine biosynthesis protein ThiS [Candidatus Sumerlaeota bacterium]|jgi:sulfur carrier protein|nr:thiamine biosynthesis protein ThiS [Candidatus Sumerlaeota bacterium]